VRTESLIALAIFAVVGVIAMAFMLTSKQDIDSRVHVVDGNAIRHNSQRIRLLGLDAAQRRLRGLDAASPLGAASPGRARELAPSPD
jgi:hypothetical protein